MDNFHIDVLHDEREIFDLAMRIAFRKQKATHYIVDPKKGLVLLWSTYEKATPLPYPMDCVQATEFVWGWLLHQQKSMDAWEPHPDIDGSVEKGFRVYNESWGHVAGMWQAFVAVRPEWTLYGK